MQTPLRFVLSEMSLFMRQAPETERRWNVQDMKGTVAITEEVDHDRLTDICIIIIFIALSLLLREYGIPVPW